MKTCKGIVCLTQTHSLHFLGTCLQTHSCPGLSPCPRLSHNDNTLVYEQATFRLRHQNMISFLVCFSVLQRCHPRRPHGTTAGLGPATAHRRVLEQWHSKCGIPSFPLTPALRKSLRAWCNPKTAPQPPLLCFSLSQAGSSSSICTQGLVQSIGSRCPRWEEAAQRACACKDAEWCCSSQAIEGFAAFLLLLSLFVLTFLILFLYILQPKSSHVRVVLFSPLCLLFSFSSLIPSFDC